MCKVKTALTTTSEQRSPVNNGQFDSSTTSLNLPFIRPLFQTTTFFRSQEWSLYTGLNVQWAPLNGITDNRINRLVGSN